MARRQQVSAIDCRFIILYIWLAVNRRFFFNLAKKSDFFDFLAFFNFVSQLVIIVLHEYNYILKV